MERRIKSYITNSELDQKLVEGIIELVSIFPGIHQNSLRRKLVDKEKICAKSTFEDKIKNLVNDEIIEAKKGKGKETNYYISGLGGLHRNVYDDKFAKVLFKIRDLIRQIESLSRDFNEEVLEQTLAAMGEIQQKCSVIMSWYDQQNKYSEKEDVMFNKIKDYETKYHHELIINQVAEASKIYEKIKDTNDEKFTIIKQLIKSKSPSIRTKLINKLIKNRRENKKQLDNLNGIYKIMSDRKLQMQEKVFTEVIDSLNEKTKREQPYQKIETLRKLHIILANLPKQEINFVSSFQNIIDSSEEPLKSKLNNKLNEIRMPFKDGSGYAELLRDVISSLEKEIRKPIKEKILIKKLMETNLFSKRDAIDMISHMSFGGPIFRSKDEIYKIKFLA